VKGSHALTTRIQWTGPNCKDQENDSKTPIDQWQLKKKLKFVLLWLLFHIYLFFDFTKEATQAQSQWKRLQLGAFKWKLCGSLFSFNYDWDMLGGFAHYPCSIVGFDSTPRPATNESIVFVGSLRKPTTPLQVCNNDYNYKIYRENLFFSQGILILINASTKMLASYFSQGQYENTILKGDQTIEKTANYLLFRNFEGKMC
jgi:hypothetical protein